MQLTIIAALARNRVIGRDGAIPWDIPEDRRRFRQLTINHTVLMGRKTYLSIGKPLPLRRNVILSHTKISRMESYPSLEEALEALNEERYVFVIGGGDVYRQTIRMADELRLTLVNEETEGDVFFPPYEGDIGRVWKEVHREGRAWGAFVDFERVTKTG